MKIGVPGGTLPDAQLEWHVPEKWNAFERNRARAYAIPYSAMVSMENWLLAMQLLRQGETAVSTKFEMPQKGTQIGVGFWGAGRGYLSHHLIIDGGVIAKYQILTPSTLNAAPRTPWGTPGPYEEAVLNTPILEDYSSPEAYKGIDVKTGDAVERRPSDVPDFWRKREGEKAAGVLPPADLELTLTTPRENALARTITLAAHTSWGKQCLSHFQPSQR